MQDGRPKDMRSESRREILNDELFDPCDFMAAEHRQQREMFHRLCVLADDLHATGCAPEAGDIRDYLTLALHPHLEDEYALLSLVARRMAIEGAGEREIDAAWRELAAVHRLVPPVVDGLGALAGGLLPAAPDSFVVSALTLSEFMKMHIAFEETTLFPLARAEIDGADLRRLAQAIAARHGVEALPPPPRVPPIRPGDRFRETKPPHRGFSVVRIVRPPSGRLHAWLRAVGGAREGEGAHLLLSLDTLREGGSYVRVEPGEGSGDDEQR